MCSAMLRAAMLGKEGETPLSRQKGTHMDATLQSARDELLYKQVKSEKSLNFGLCVVLSGATLLTVVFAIGIVVLNKGLNAFLADLELGIGAALPALLYWNEYKECAKALDEIGDDPTGIDTRKTYSRETAFVIAGSRRSKSELRQLWIAYGILAFVMIVFGLFFLALLASSAYIEILFVIAGGVMWIGGLLLAILTVRSFRQWLMARRIEKLERQEAAAK